MASGGDLLHIIAAGGPEDWEAGRGSLYYIEDRNGKTALPVFTTAERAEAFVQANFNTPEAHMQMLESAGASHASPLTAGRYMIMPVRAEGIALAARRVDADYLVRDIRPGSQQEILRLDEE
jgi:hypothetical protein